MIPSLSSMVEES